MSDVLRASLALLRRLELNFTTPGEAPGDERPGDECRDAIPSHFGLFPGQQDDKVSTFKDIIPSEVEFPCLQHFKMTNIPHSQKVVGAFLAKHSAHLGQSHRLLFNTHARGLTLGASRNNDSEYMVVDAMFSTFDMMQALRSAAGYSADLSVLTYEQVETPHHTLCIGLGIGRHWQTYYRINAADLATMYSAGVTHDEILLTVSFEALITIIGREHNRTCADHLGDVSEEHLKQYLCAKSNKEEILAGKDGEALVALGRLKLRTMSTLLGTASEMQMDVDFDTWTRVDPLNVR